MAAKNPVGESWQGFLLIRDSESHEALARSMPASKRASVGDFHVNSDPVQRANGTLKFTKPLTKGVRG